MKKKSGWFWPGSEIKWNDKSSYRNSIKFTGLFDFLHLIFSIYIKLKLNFLGNTAASNTKKARFCRYNIFLFWKTFLSMVGIGIWFRNFPKAGSGINSSGSTTLKLPVWFPLWKDFYLHYETLERYALKIVGVLVVELEVVVEDERRLHVHRHL